MNRVAAVCAVVSTVALGTGIAFAAQDNAPPLAGRAFDVNASAYPFEPAAGANASPELVRLVETTASVSNPPVEADARAAAEDLGQAEAYSAAYAQGPQASASTRNNGRASHQEMQTGGSDYVADVDPSPRASGNATATGVKDGTQFVAQQAQSASRADGSGKTLVATASSVVHDLVVGPVTIGAANYHARASAAGTPGSARATASVTVSDASIGGVPVVITSTGVQVDQSKVPADGFVAATKAVHDALAQGGYLDVRVTQPKTSTAPDGSAATVSGGGIFFYGTNNDPSNYYFVRVTVLTGIVQVAIGSQFGAAPQTIVPPLTPVQAAPARPSAQGVQPRAVPPASRGVAHSSENAVPPLRFVSARGSVGLPDTWRGWPWLLAAFGAIGLLVSACWLPVAVPVRRRASRWGIAFAVRYLRG